MKGLPFSKLIMGYDASAGDTSSGQSEGLVIPGMTQAPKIPDVLPILPVRNTVIFPGTITPLTIGRPSSRQLLEESLGQSKMIGICAQKNPDVDNPAPEDIYHVGVAAIVLKLFRHSEEHSDCCSGVAENSD